MAFLAHMSHYCIRLVMIFSKVVVWKIWSKRSRSEFRGENKEKFSRLITNYRIAGKSAALYQNLFQEWFVIQWLIYFLAIVRDCTVIVNILLNGQYDKKHHLLWFSFTHLVHDIVVFLIPYICGTLMNYAHKQYHKSLKREQETILSAEDIQWMLQCADLIPEEHGYQFIPSILCLSIPLDSAGYTLSVLLSLLALLATIITAFVET